MKKVSRKLSLNRETIATLSPELLDSVGGGQAIASVSPPRTLTTVTTVTRTSQIGCPSRLPGICETDPHRTRLICGPQGGPQK